MAQEGTNVEKVLLALGQFGFPTLGLSPDEVIAGTKILRAESPGTRLGSPGPARFTSSDGRPRSETSGRLAEPKTRQSSKLWKNSRSGGRGRILPGAAVWGARNCSCSGSRRRCHANELTRVDGEVASRLFYRAPAAQPPANAAGDVRALRMADRASAGPTSIGLPETHTCARGASPQQWGRRRRGFPSSAPTSRKQNTFRLARELRAKRHEASGTQARLSSPARILGADERLQPAVRALPGHDG